MAVSACVAATTAQTTETKPRSQLVGVARVAIDSDPSFPDLSLAGERHSYVILQSWREDEATAIKSVNPDVKVLAYKNLSAASATVGPRGHISSGVSYAEARAKPAWFLKTDGGEPFKYRGYSFLWAMNVGKAGYQNRWASNVIADLQPGPWDGVFMDDTNPTMKYHHDLADIENELDTDREWQLATEAALARISRQVHAAGLLVVPNFGAWGEYSDEVTPWLKYVDGAMDEMFVKWGDKPRDGYAWEGRWEQQLENLKQAQRLGKDFIGIAHSANDDVEAARYGYATMLLGSSGNASFALQQDYSTAPWFDVYDRDIGSPVEREKVKPNGVHSRRFSRGLVLVNPTGASQRVTINGKYSGSDVASRRTVEMDPHTGLLLSSVQKDGPDDVSGAGPSVKMRERGAIRIQSGNRREMRLKASCGQAGACRHRVVIWGRAGAGTRRSLSRFRLSARTVRVSHGARLITVRLSRRDRRMVRKAVTFRIWATSRIRAGSRRYRCRTRTIRIS